jgi:energy-coupling factor transporter transmembrane protein EcfT
MITNKVVANGVVGFVFFALFTILVETYDKHPQYLKISTFLWSAPLFFLFMIFITKSSGRDVLLSFTKHALLGTALSIFIFSFTLLISRQPMYVIIGSNVLLIAYAIYTYFTEEMYNI